MSHPLHDPRDECKAREFLEVIGMQLSVHSLMEHVGELVERLKTMDTDEVLAWRVGELGSVNNRGGLYLNEKKREKVKRMLALAAEHCDYGRMLRDSEARHSAVLKNWIAEHAREVQK